MPGVSFACASGLYDRREKRLIFAREKYIRLLSRQDAGRSPFVMAEEFQEEINAGIVPLETQKTSEVRFCGRRCLDGRQGKALEMIARYSRITLARFDFFYSRNHIANYAGWSDSTDVGSGIA